MLIYSSRKLRFAAWTTVCQCTVVPPGNTALAVLPAPQKSSGRTGSEAQEDSTEEMQAVGLQSVERVLQTLGVPSAPPFCCCEGGQESCVFLLPYL